jgi:hypothetical protein
MTQSCCVVEVEVEVDKRRGSDVGLKRSGASEVKHLKYCVLESAETRFSATQRRRSESKPQKRIQDWSHWLE